MTTSDDGGGSIIAKRWILTAAHLTTNNSTKLYAGVANRNNLNTPFNMSQRVKYPYFTGNNHDLALIKVDRDFNYASGIAPVKLVSSSNTSLWNVGQLPTVTGFGRTSNTSAVSNELKSVSVPITSIDLTNNKIRAGNNNFDSCHGDSGGPMAISNTQIGTVNLGGDCGGGNGIGGDYMMVSPYLAWIISTIHLEGTPDIVCNDTVFENLGVMPDGVSFTWTASPASLFTSTTGTGLTFTPGRNSNSINGVGFVTLTAKDSNGSVMVTVTKQVWVGVPSLTLVTDGTFSINGQFASICKGFGYCMTAKCEPMQDAKYSNIVTGFTWSLAPSGMYRNIQTYSIFGLPTVPNNQACFGASVAGTYILTVTANTLYSNVCGTNSKNIIIQANSCGYRVAQNPTQTSLSVLFDNPELKESIPIQLDLLDEKSGKALKTLTKANKEDSLVKKGDSSLLMDVANLPRGLYYLHLTFGNRVDKVRVILN